MAYKTSETLQMVNIVLRSSDNLSRWNRLITPSTLCAESPTQKRVGEGGGKSSGKVTKERKIRKWRKCNQNYRQRSEVMVAKALPHVHGYRSALDPTHVSMFLVWLPNRLTYPLSVSDRYLTQRALSTCLPHTNLVTFSLTSRSHPCRTLDLPSNSTFLVVEFDNLCSEDTLRAKFYP